MKKLLCNICCAFIIKKRNRRHFREKYKNRSIFEAMFLSNEVIDLLNGKQMISIDKERIGMGLDRIERGGGVTRVDDYLIKRSIFYNRLQELKSRKKIPEIDYMNSIIFAFDGGFVDQLYELMFAIKNINRISENIAIYFFIKSDAHKYDGIEVCKYYNVKKYINYEIIDIPSEVIELYNVAGLYGHYRTIRTEENEVLFFNPLFPLKYDRFCFKPPFVFTLFESYVDYENLQDLMTLQVPLDERNKLKLEQIKSCENSVCIHIRMGDVLKPGFAEGYLPSVNYFINSIKQIQEKLNTKNINYFVFCSSMEVAKNRLLKEKFIQDLSIDFIDINKDNEPCFEMELMRNCNHFIVSGGGYSNLATILGKHENKIIIKPTNEDYFIDKEKEWHYKYVTNWKEVDLVC